MPTQNDPTEDQMNKRMKLLKRVFQEWDRNLDYLQDEKEKVSEDQQETFQAEIDDLQEQLDYIQVRLQSMEEGDPKEWMEGHEALREKMELFKNDMEKTADRLGDAYKEDSTDWQDVYDDLVELDSRLLFANVYGKQTIS